MMSDPTSTGMGNEPGGAPSGPHQDLASKAIANSVGVSSRSHFESALIQAAYPATTTEAVYEAAIIIAENALKGATRWPGDLHRAKGLLDPQIDNIVRLVATLSEDADTPAQKAEIVAEIFSDELQGLHAAPPLSLTNAFLTPAAQTLVLKMVADKLGYNVIPVILNPEAESEKRRIDLQISIGDEHFQLHARQGKAEIVTPSEIKLSALNVPVLGYEWIEQILQETSRLYEPAEFQMNFLGLKEAMLAHKDEETGLDVRHYHSYALRRHSTQILTETGEI